MFKKFVGQKPKLAAENTTDMLASLAGKCWIDVFNEGDSSADSLALATVAQCTLRAHHDLTNQFGMVATSSIEPQKFWDICGAVCVYWIAVAAQVEREDTKNKAYDCLSVAHIVFSRVGVLQDRNASESEISGFAFKLMTDIEHEPYEPSKTLNWPPFRPDTLA